MVKRAAVFREPTTADITAAFAQMSSTNKFRVIQAVSWTVFATVHILGVLFFGLSAYGYWILPHSDIERYLSSYGIGISSRHYRAIGAAYAAVALIHAVLLLQMVFLSVRRKYFVFNSSQHIRLHRGKSRAKEERSPGRLVKRTLFAIYSAFFTTDGLLGVSGPCFELILLVRESVETVLQTAQAYKMSRVLARAWINRFYVSLLVLSCWTTALVHIAFHRKPGVKYFAALVCDFVLDWTSSMIVPTILVCIYNSDRDPAASDVFGLKWFDDVWVMNAMNEFQLILVVSWGDLATRLVFAISMIANVNTLKRFMSTATNVNSSSQTRPPKRAILPQPTHDSRRKGPTMSAFTRTNSIVKNHPVLTKLLRAIFLAWGLAILVLHIQADAIEALPQCVMQVRPWGVARPSCNLILMNCEAEHMSGRSSEIHDRLSALHPLSIEILLVRHCCEFEMPPIVQTLGNLKGIKLYNSTVVKWAEDAALTQVHHPALVLLALLRTNTSDGMLPAGLQSYNFPHALRLIGFAHSNINSLPEDLHLKWPQYSFIYLDTTQIAVVPDVLLRMKLRFLVLAGSPVETVPAKLFELPTLEFVHLGYTKISSLPDNVSFSAAPALAAMNLDGTDIFSFPAWADQWLKRKPPALFSLSISASGSPYCADRQRIQAGSQTSFTTPTPSKLMDAAPSNWAFLDQVVSCTPTALYRYPLELDDMFSALH